jgi:hypothetical protein
MCRTLGDKPSAPISLLALHFIIHLLRYMHFSSDSAAPNCSSASNVGETLSSTGSVQRTWVYSRFNTVAYNITTGLNMTLGHVYTPLLPIQSAASDSPPVAFSGMSVPETQSAILRKSPIVLRLVKSSEGSLGEPDVFVFTNDDDASGWNTVRLFPYPSRVTFL